MNSITVSECPWKSVRDNDKNHLSWNTGYTDLLPFPNVIF